MKIVSKALLALSFFAIGFPVITKAEGNVYVSDRAIDNSILNGFSYRLTDEKGKEFPLIYNEALKHYEALEIPDGKYKLETVEKPEGYEAEEVVMFEIKENQEIIKITPKHTYKKETPSKTEEPKKDAPKNKTLIRTGEAKEYYQLVGYGALGFSGLIIYLHKRKEN